MLTIFYAVAHLAILNISSGDEVATDITDEPMIVQMLLIVLLNIFSLLVIRTLRYSNEGVRKRIGESLRAITLQLGPFFINSIILSLKLMPLSLAVFLLGIAFVNEIPNSEIEAGIVLAIGAGVSILSLLWLTSNIMAQYIVSLPGANVWAGMTTAKVLVKNRRYYILGRLAIYAILIIGLVFFTYANLSDHSGTTADFIDGSLIAVSIILFHSMMYCVYKDLL